LNMDRFFGIFNRNTTLTGRIPMWLYLYHTYIAHRPLGGYGFNAFWYLESHRVIMGLVAGYPDPIVISDNGFIDLLLNTGFVGIFLFSIFYLYTWWRSIKYAWKSDEISGFFPMIIMAFTLIANISWSLIYENESFFILLMFICLFQATRPALTTEST
jgi:exopolysaccharide production protein ExoQ